MRLSLLSPGFFRRFVFSMSNSDHWNALASMLGTPAPQKRRPRTQPKPTPACSASARPAAHAKTPAPGPAADWSQLAQELGRRPFRRTGQAGKTRRGTRAAASRDPLPSQRARSPCARASTAARQDRGRPRKTSRNRANPSESDPQTNGMQRPSSFAHSMRVVRRRSHRPMLMSLHPD